MQPLTCHKFVTNFEINYLDPELISEAGVVVASFQKNIVENRIGLVGRYIFCDRKRCSATSIFFVTNKNTNLLKARPEPALRPVTKCDNFKKKACFVTICHKLLQGLFSERYQQIIEKQGCNKFWFVTLCHTLTKTKSND